MAGEQPDQLRPDVAGRPDDADTQAARPSVGLDPALRAGRIPDERSVAIAAGDSSPVLTGTLRPLTGGWLGWLAGIGRTVAMGV